MTVRTGGSAPAEHRAAAAVVAFPMNCLGDVPFDPPLSDGKLAAARERHAGHGSKVWARVDEAPAAYFGLGWMGGKGFDFVGHRGDPRGLRAARLLLARSRRSRRQGTTRSSARSSVFLPEATLLEFTCHDWAEDPYARGTWNAFRPGQVMRYETALRAAEGRLVFAGSHTALLWPGFIDGAVESGLRAGAEAHALLEAAG